MYGKKGQGVLEFMLLLAMTIVVSSIAAALLSFFPTGIDAKIIQSDIYWSGEARPFAITEHTIQSDNGDFYMLIKNRDVENLQIKTIDFSDGQYLHSFSPQNGYIGAGEEKLFQIPIQSGICTASKLYALEINITYSTLNIPNNRQIGSVLLTGQCSLYSESGSQSNPRANGQPCSNPNDCDSHHCFSGICVECIGNGHCPIGDRCVENQCIS